MSNTEPKQLTQPILRKTLRALLRNHDPAALLRQMEAAAIDLAAEARDPVDEGLWMVVAKEIGRTAERVGTL